MPNPEGYIPQQPSLSELVGMTQKAERKTSVSRLFKEPTVKTENGDIFVDITPFIIHEEDGVMIFPPNPLSLSEGNEKMPLSFRYTVIVNDEQTGTAVPFDVITKGVPVRFHESIINNVDTSLQVRNAFSDIAKVSKATNYPTEVITMPEDYYLFSEKGRRIAQDKFRSSKPSIYFIPRSDTKLTPGDKGSIFTREKVPNDDVLQRTALKISKVFGSPLNEERLKKTRFHLKEPINEKPMQQDELEKWKEAQEKTFTFGKYTVHEEQIIKTPFHPNKFLYITRFTTLNKHGGIEEQKLLTAESIRERLMKGETIPVKKTVKNQRRNVEQQFKEMKELYAGIERKCGNCMEHGSEIMCDCKDQMEERIKLILENDGVHLYLPHQTRMGYGAILSDITYFQIGIDAGTIATGKFPDTNKYPTKNTTPKLLIEGLPEDLTDYDTVELIHAVYGKDAQYAVMTDNKKKVGAISNGVEKSRIVPIKAKRKRNMIPKLEGVYLKEGEHEVHGNGNGRRTLTQAA